MYEEIITSAGHEHSLVVVLGKLSREKVQHVSSGINRESTKVLSVLPQP